MHTYYSYQLLAQLNSKKKRSNFFTRCTFILQRGTVVHMNKCNIKLTCSSSSSYFHYLHRLSHSFKIKYYNVLLIRHNKSKYRLFVCKMCKLILFLIGELNLGILVFLLGPINGFTWKSFASFNIFRRNPSDAKGSSLLRMFVSEHFSSRQLSCF